MMLALGETPIEPVLIIDVAPVNIRLVPASAAKSAHVPIDTVPVTKRVVKSTQEPLLTVKLAIDQAWPCKTDLSPSLREVVASRLPMKILDTPTVTLDPAHHHTFFD